MIPATILLAVTTIACAAWLQWNENLAGDNASRTEPVGTSAAERSERQLDQHYLESRARGRTRTNIVIAVCGCMILSTAFLKHPVLWMTGWYLVMIGFLVVIIMAAKDAIRTHRYHRDKLPFVRRRVMGDQSTEPRPSDQEG